MNPDKRLDTISSSIGYGVQVQTTRSPKPNYVTSLPGTHYPANGLNISVFTASSAEEGGCTPSESANLFLCREDTDKLIALLQEHRSRMNPEPAAAGSAA